MTRRTQENLKLAQIAKDAALNQLIQSDKNNRDKCYETFSEADSKEKEAYMQQMIATLKREMQDEKDATVKRITEEKDA